MKLKNIIQLFIIGVFLFGLTSQVKAATYYMNADGSEDCSNLQECLGIMSGGDELVIRDGVYAGSENTIHPWNYPPSGSNESYTVIRAEHSGKVIFDGERARTLVDLNGNGMNPQPSYIEFEGLVFRNSMGALTSFIYVNHIKLKKCFFYDTDNTDEQYSDSIFFRYSDYVLLEDCVTWGNGRYHYFILDSDHFILRRCLDRYDRGVAVGYSNMGSFRIYSSSDVELQNCIAIDGDQGQYYLQHSDSGLVSATPKSYWPAGANGPTDNVHIRGSFALNDKDMSMYILSPQWDPKNNVVENSVFWDGRDGLWSRVGVEKNTIFNHLTIGKIAGLGWDTLKGEYGYSVVAKNNIFYQNDGYVLSWTDNDENSSDYNAFYGNEHNYSTSHGSHPQVHDLSLENSNEIDPSDGSPGNGVPALKYLTRIENNSDLDGAASDGGDIGATILYKIGRDGTLWGEEGYDEQTNQPLWPFPNEDLIKEKMQAYSYDNGNLTGNRGFAEDTNDQFGKPLTLTRYIWQYLGNQIPCEIYDECNQSQTVRADVDNNSTINTTDAMLTLRNSLGLNMSNTNWFSSTTTGDVNCDGNSNSTDAMLILRYSLGLDMSGTGWCE
jgi:hypothetical protein